MPKNYFLSLSVIPKRTLLFPMRPKNVQGFLPMKPENSKDPRTECLAPCDTQNQNV